MVYFIALRIDMNPKIESILQKLKKSKGEFVENDQLHQTILFLGEECNISKTKKIINKLNINLITLRANKIMALADSRYENAIALKIKKTKEIKKIHNYLRKNLPNSSIFKNYMPHISLVRTNENVENTLKNKKIKEFRIIAKKIALIQAQKIKNRVKYKIIYEKSLDDFENRVFNIINDLKSLKKFGISSAILYGSTAYGIIKKPVHDIDIMLCSNHPTITVEQIGQMKNFIGNICKKYSDENVDVKTWSVGLGRILENVKIKRKKLNIGIEIFLLPKITMLTNISKMEIGEKRYRILFGKIDFLPERKIGPPGYIEYIYSRFLINIFENRNPALLETYFYQFLFNFLERKGIFVGNKNDLTEAFSRNFPHIKMPKIVTFNSLNKFYEKLLEES